MKTADFSKSAVEGSSKDGVSGPRYGVEDCLVVVAGLLECRGYARIVMVAEVLGVGCHFVADTIAKMVRKGWVRRELYRNILLTEEGRREVHRLKKSIGA